MKYIVFACLFCVASICAMAQKIDYSVSFPHLEHHEASITLTVSGIPAEPAIFRMSRSSAGRYATHEFGKNIYDISASDKDGHPLPIERIDGDVYRVARHNGFVRVNYTLFGNYADGTYVGLDETNVHINMPGAFMWMKGLDNLPITISFHLPAGKAWTIATQLKPTADPGTFTARNLQYFMDCPTKIGNLSWAKWNISNPDGKNYEFRLALEANTTDSLTQAFAVKVKRIVQQAQAVFGETPAYDYGTYTFLASINPFVKGDGMEHRNSTMISTPRNFNGADNQLGVFAHEFFHCWNVKRIRPKSLEPFNFEKSDMSSELWLAEGFTQYYGQLLMVRSGFETPANWFNNVGSFVNTKENTPGARRFSPAENSRHAVFVDAAVSIDKTNYGNMFTSYYTYGGAVALALDLTLRTQFHLTLDNYMQALWKKHGKPEIPYTIPDLQNALAGLTKDDSFAKDFFARYVYGHESFDYSNVLGPAGLQLQKAQPGVAWIGRAAYTDGKGVTVTSPTTWGTPLYEAGVDVDDVINFVDGMPVSTQAELNRIIAAHHPGDNILLQYTHRDIVHNVSLRLGENPAYKVVPFEETVNVASVTTWIARGATATNGGMLKINKTVIGTTGTTVGSTITYNISVTNTGNLTMTNVMLNDAGATITGTNPIVSLAPGAVANLTATHIITQSDIDAAKELPQAVKDFRASWIGNKIRE